MARSLPLLLALVVMGCDGQDRGRPATEAPKVVAKQAPPAARKVPEAAAPPKAPPAADPVPQPAPPAPLTFTDALTEAKRYGAEVGREFELELPKKKKLLTENEIDRLDRLMYAASRNDRMMPGPDNAAWMRRLGLDRWVASTAIKGACADRDFVKCARWVWGRAPNSRNATAIAGLAVRWGTTDAIELLGLVASMDFVERGIPIREDARDAVLRFAGEEYLTNRP